MSVHCSNLLSKNYVYHLGISYIKKVLDLCSYIRAMAWPVFYIGVHRSTDRCRWSRPEFRLFPAGHQLQSLEQQDSNCGSAYGSTSYSGYLNMDWEGTRDALIAVELNFLGIPLNGITGSLLLHAILHQLIFLEVAIDLNAVRFIIVGR